MRIFKHINDPVYVRRPWQILRRLYYLAQPPTGDAEASLPWGDRLSVRAGEKNGRTILERGLDQLTVVEACIRLVDPGGVAVDIGANYGQMSLALAYGAQPEGTVYAFEPHPRLFKYLKHNAEGYPGIVPIQKAVSEEVGRFTLHVPRTWRSDAGVSSLNSDFRKDTQGVEVETTSMDSEFEKAETIDVLKVDVEGHEDRVFAGGEMVLSGGRVKNILFEEHNYTESTAVNVLKENGYRLFTIEKTLKGPKLVGPRPGKKDYIASLDEKECMGKFDEGGWKALEEK
jgi:FkbM family methyltransferase